MRITAGALRRIIREEVVRNLLRENENNSDPLAKLKALKDPIDEYYDDFQAKIVALSDEARERGDKQASSDLHWWSRNASLGWSLRRVYESVAKEARRKDHPNMAEDWDAFSGKFLSDLQEFAEFCTKRYPNDKDLADLHERGEDLINQIEAALPEEGHQKDNAPWSEKSPEDKQRRKDFDRTYHAQARTGARDYRRLG